MISPTRRAVSLLTLFVGASLVAAGVPACGEEAASEGVPSARDAGSEEASPSDASGGIDLDVGPGGEGGASCLAPDMLIALDRTGTMHRNVDGDPSADTPEGHASAKWTLAIEGVEQLTAAPLDQGIGFGLELWPKAYPGCITLGERIEGVLATNAHCEEGEVVVDTSLGAGAKIAAALDPETTPICGWTPTGAGLVTAGAYLEARTEPGRQQYVVLVTDGADWDVTCPDPDPIGVVDDLRAKGIMTIVVGFSAEASLQNGVGAAFLNDMACAGGMAKGFDEHCVQDWSGKSRAKDPDAGPSGTLFYVATSPAELASSLSALAKTVCCGCVK